MKVIKEKVISYAKKRLEEEIEKEAEKKEKGEYKETEDSIGITILWWGSILLLVIADGLEIIFNLITLATGGTLFFLPYITLFFEIPGLIIFAYLIHYYIKTEVLGLLEGALYLLIVGYELAVTFIPIAQISDSLPLKTIASFVSRYRVARLWKVRKAIKKKGQEEKEEEEKEES